MKMMTLRFTLLCISLYIANVMLPNASHAQFMKDVVAIWLFDEGNGKKINDYARKGHDGVFLTGKPDWVEGRFGTALQFHGVDGMAWADIEKPVAMDSVDFSIGCWMKPGKPQRTWANLLAGRDEEKSHTGISLLQYENHVNRYRIAIGGVFAWEGLGNPRHGVQLITDEWNHLVFVRKGRNGTWYLNGEPDRPMRNGFHIDLGSEKRLGRARKNFRIGTAVFDDARRWRGILDETFIFERALNQEEIVRIMNEGIVEGQHVDAKGKMATVWGKIKSSN